MDIHNLYQLFLNCSGVTTDTRNCQQESMFFALKGETFNGNQFASQALEKGCAYVVVDEPDYAIEGDGRYILVRNVLNALQQLANFHRNRLKTKVLGITGTNGKTTTKELVFAVLSQSYHVLCTQGNLNNHIGVPLTLLRLTPAHEIAVIEMGANHPGEIKTLVEIAEPDLGIITNVGKAHLEGFGSFDGVLRTKGELYDFLRLRKGSVVFIDQDNPYLTDRAKGLKQIPYGTDRSLYINGQVIANSPYLSIAWRAGEGGEAHLLETRLVGEYNFTNILAAISIGCFFGVDSERINQAIRSYEPQNSRSQLKQTEDNTLIIDAYNANPTSMMAALKNFKNMTAERKMLILGDMRELGEEGASEHQKIVDFIDSCHFDKVILVGNLFAATRNNYSSYTDVQELIYAFRERKPQKNTILIKGSNGIKLYQLVDFL